MSTCLSNARVIVELKSVERLAPVNGKKLLTYLRLLDLRVGLLVNFGEATLKEGLHRVVNRLEPSASPRLRVNRPGNAAKPPPPDADQLAPREPPSIGRWSAPPREPP